MARKNITRQDAERVLNLVQYQNNIKESEQDRWGPTLVENWDWSGHPTRWAIVWEEGPYEWAYHFPFGGVDEELTAALQDFAPGKVVRRKEVQLPDHIFTEAITSFAIGIYLA